MARNSFAGRVLKAIKAHDKGGFGLRAADLIAPLNIQSRKDAKKISVALGDHHRAGRLVKIMPGLYRLPRPKETLLPHPLGMNRQVEHPAPPLVKEKMWSILRMRGTVTVADLQELTGASAGYAKEYLRMLAKREIVKSLRQPDNKPWKYQLVKRDLVNSPEDNKKADRLQAQRKKKKAAAIADFNKAAQAFEKAISHASAAFRRGVKLIRKEED